MSDFGFIVSKSKGRVVEWSVSLPHQCDDWEIAGGNGYFVPHDEAVLDLTTFIREASSALDKLVSKQEQDES